MTRQFAAAIADAYGHAHHSPGLIPAALIVIVGVGVYFARRHRR